MPPLRERPEDIAPLVEHFIDTFNARYGKKVRMVDPKVMRFFERHHWPGNVRELERSIEHAFVFIKGPVIFERYLPEVETSAHRPATPHTLGPGRDTWWLSTQRTTPTRLLINWTSSWRSSNATPTVGREWEMSSASTAVNIETWRLKSHDDLNALRDRVLASRHPNRPEISVTD